MAETTIRSDAAWSERRANSWSSGLSHRSCDLFLAPTCSGSEQGQFSLRLDTSRDHISGGRAYELRLVEAWVRLCVGNMLLFNSFGRLCVMLSQSTRGRWRWQDRQRQRQTRRRIGWTSSICGRYARKWSSQAPTEGSGIVSRVWNS